MSETTPVGITATDSRRFEFFAALILGLAALLTGYSSMRSAIVGDEVLEGFTLSSQLYNDANSIDNANTQTAVADQALFLRYVEATFAQDDALADYLRDSLFDDRLTTAIDWWERQQAEANPPDSPFDPGSPYANEINPTAAAAAGDAAFDAAKRADTRNDRFDQATAMLSVTLVTVGIATLVRARPARATLMAVALAGLASGALLVSVGELG